MPGTLNFAYAVRVLAKSPGFTAAVVLSLALGIGANAAIFSVVNGLLFHPAGLSYPEQLVAPRVSYQKLGLDKIAMSATDFADIRDQHKIFARSALQQLDGFNYTGGSSPERLQGALVTSPWFNVLGSKPLLGRGFLPEEDQPGANHAIVLSYKPVALIDADLARRYWPRQNPLGRRLRRGSRQPWATIVGIVGHVKQSSLAAEGGHSVYYFSLYQQSEPEVFLVARGSLASAPLRQAIRRAVQASDPAQAVFDFKMMEERVALALGPQQFATRLLLVFAAVALFLAATGLYGVISYSVTRRTREIGIRTALGADPIRVVGLVIGQAMKLVVIGLFAGLIVATLLGQLASSQLFHVSAFDPVTFAMAALVLTVAALLATALPTWRAAHVDPVTALRNE